VPDIRPQPGPQEAFLSSPADIAIYGGAAYGGKTYGLLLDPLHYVEHARFGAVIFRRTSPQITNEGGLWDTSEQIYPHLKASGLPGKLQWTFPSGAKVGFSHLQHEKNKLDWQGAQIPYIGFDELTHFSAGQFWYLVSRNRDPSGTVRPHIRGTCNPDPDSFVAELIAWWIDPETGYAIPERSGVIRWFVRYQDELIWSDDPEDLKERYPGSIPKSLTFIASSYKDNPLGLAADPGYLANLENLPRVERERLKAGNWLVRPAAGDYFQRSYFPLIDPTEVPAGLQTVRYWDRAATVPSDANPDPDWTSGVRMGRSREGRYYVLHVERFRDRPAGVRARILTIAAQDGRRCTVGIEQDPGQAGVVEASDYVRALDGWPVELVPASGSKEVRAAPFSAQAGAGNVTLVRGPWLDAYLAELESFPRGKKDDQVDATSGAYSLLARYTPWTADWTPARADAGWTGAPAAQWDADDIPDPGDRPGPDTSAGRLGAGAW
jgi:predicted phage terminase large subunit-like protein